MSGWHARIQRSRSRRIARCCCLAIGVMAALLAGGCAAPGLAPSGQLASGERALRDCAALYQQLDQQIDRAGVRDAQDARLPGFPYLRVSRGLASFRQQAQADPALLRALVDAMSALDLAARRLEIANLPLPVPDVQAMVGSGAGRAEPGLPARLADCAARLRDADLSDPPTVAALLERVRVPDDYSTTSRVLGLYALTRYPFSLGVQRHQRQVLAAHGAPLSVPAAGVLDRLAPVSAPAFTPLTHSRAATLIAQASANPLGVPVWQPGERDRLLAAHAPVYEIMVAGDADRIGAPGWQPGSTAPQVASADPVVFTQAGWTRYRGRTLVQLTYTVWFSQRPADSALDLLAGQLDGLTWRVTLAPDGEPLLYDTIHPCGCYHQFYPTPRAVPLAAPDPDHVESTEWLFVPQRLPPVAPDQRTVLRIAARTHYLQRVTLQVDRAGLMPAPDPAATATAAARAYRMVDADTLRSLPLPGVGRTSLYGPDGLVAGTDRGERLLFWPMGIRSAGAMRQPGRQATAFVGRQHFDDADLLDKRFVLELR